MSQQYRRCHNKDTNCKRPEKREKCKTKQAQNETQPGTTHYNLVSDSNDRAKSDVIDVFCVRNKYLPKEVSDSTPIVFTK